MEVRLQLRRNPMLPSAPLPEEDLNHVLTHTRQRWEELRGQRIFVTGGTGFFGRWLLESFAWANRELALGASAVVLTRRPDVFRTEAPHLAACSAIEFLAGDVRSFAFPSGRFTHVIHAATEASAKLNDEDPLTMLDTIVGGTRRVLDFAAQAGTRKLLLTSSGAVYGKQPSDLTHISEEYPGAPDPLDPKSAYGEGKRMAEHLCVLYAGRHGFEVKIARCFAFVGPHLPLGAHFAIGNFIRDAMAGGPVRVQGDGTPFRSYLYAADLAIWLWTILFKGRSQRAYNVGAAEPITIRETAQAVALVGSVPLSMTAQELLSGRGGCRYVPDVRRAMGELGLRTEIPLQEAVCRTVYWLGIPKD